MTASDHEKSMIEVERAVLDLRRGCPVVITEGSSSAHLIASAELIDQAWLTEMRALSTQQPHILLTHNRAKTLKIRLYTEEAIAIAMKDQDNLELIRHLSDPSADLGHPLMGPFQAERDQPGKCEIAGIELAKLAGLLPSVVSISLANLGGPPNPDAFAKSRGLLSVESLDISDFDTASATKLEKVSELPFGLQMVSSADVPLKEAPKARLIAFRPQGLLGGGPEHLAIVIGHPEPHQPVLARLHSECFTGDLLGSLKCDCGDQLRGAIREIAESGDGILLYLAQEGRGIGLMNKLRAYALQDQGFDTVEANQRLGFETDERLFACAAEMLKKLGFSAVRLMTNNPDKVAQLETCGIEVTERVRHSFPSNEHNAHYLATKAKKTGHIL